MARFHLGLTDRQFFQLTPRQMHLLMERRRERSEHEELLAGIIAATVANHSFARPKEAMAPGDFMPSQWRRREEKAAAAPPRLSRKLIAQNVRCFLKARVEAQSS